MPRLPFRPVLLLAALLLLAAPATAPAKAKKASLSVPIPAAGQASAAVAKLKGKVGGKVPLKVKRTAVPPGVVVKGTVSGGKQGRRIVVMAARKPGAARRGVVARAAATSITVQVRRAGVKLTGKRTVANALGGSAPGNLLGTGVCNKAAALESALAAAKSLGGSGVSSTVLSTLADALVARLCGEQLTPAQQAALAAAGFGAGTGTPGGGGLGTPAPLNPIAASPLPPPSTGGGTIGGGSTGPVCADGVDNDGDGQADAYGSGAGRPDPGCSDVGDTSENSELTVAAACAESSSAGQNDGQAQKLFVAVNQGCPTFRTAWVDVAPGIGGCDFVSTGEDGFQCSVVSGDLRVQHPSGTTTDMFDSQVTLTGAAVCSVPATIAFIAADGTASELVEPINNCQGGGSGGGDECSDGEDNDGDGQADAFGTGADRPDPGCSDAGDTSEDSELVVGAGCQAGFGQSTEDRSEIFVGINQGCPSFRRLWVDATPGIAQCESVSTGVGDFSCQPVGGDARVEDPAGTVTDMADFVVKLAGNADCSKPMTVAFIDENGIATELVEDIGGCQTGGGDPACSNGEDDDGDGQIDAFGAGVPRPDPGCESGADTSEGGEDAAPGSCSIVVGFLESNPRTLESHAWSCGTVTSIALDADNNLGGECLTGAFDGQGTPYAWGTCTAAGGNARAEGDATTDEVAIQIATTANRDYQCGNAVWVWLRLGDDTFIERRVALGRFTGTGFQAC